MFEARRLKAFVFKIQKLRNNTGQANDDNNYICNGISGEFKEQVCCNNLKHKSHG